MTKQCGPAIIALLFAMGRFDYVRGYCETFNNEPSINVCQAGAVTGTVIYLDSDGAPDTGRVLCQCSLTHDAGTTTQRIWAATAWNQKEGVKFEIEDEVLYNNTEHISFDLLSGSVIMFMKTVVSDEAAVCVGLLAGSEVGNITVTCSSTIQDLPSKTDAPHTQPTNPPTQPTSPPTQPTVPPTQPTFPPTQQTVPSNQGTTRTIQPPVTTTAAGSGEDDGYTSNDDIIGISIIAVTVSGATVVVVVAVVITVLTCKRLRNLKRLTTNSAEPDSHYLNVSGSSAYTHQAPSQTNSQSASGDTCTPVNGEQGLDEEPRSYETSAMETASTPGEAGVYTQIDDSVHTRHGGDRQAADAANTYEPLQPRDNPDDYHPYESPSADEDKVELDNQVSVQFTNGAANYTALQLPIKDEHVYDTHE